MPYADDLKKRNAYMADYMAKVRKGYISRPARYKAALLVMEAKLSGNDKPLAVELRRIIAEALA